MKFKKNVVALLSACALFAAAPQASAFSWNGWLAGIDVGYSAGKVKATGLDPNDTTGIFSGFHEEIPMYEHSFEPLSNAKLKLGKASFGLTGGYLHELENTPVVLGVRLGLGYAGKGSVSDPREAWNSDEDYKLQYLSLKGTQVRSRLEAGIGGLAGYKIKERWLPYATVGLKVERLKVRMADGLEFCRRGEEDLQWSCEDLSAYSWSGRFLSSDNFWSWGVHYGVGAYYALTDNWLINAEVGRTQMWGLSGHWGNKYKGHNADVKLGLVYKF